MGLRPLRNGDLFSLPAWQHCWEPAPKCLSCMSESGLGPRAPSLPVFLPTAPLCPSWAASHPEGVATAGGLPPLVSPPGFSTAQSRAPPHGVIRNFRDET